MKPAALFGLTLVSASAAAMSAFASTWVELPGDQFSRDFECDVATRNEEALHAIEVGQAFTLAVKADAKDVKAATLTFEAEGRPPLVLQSETCLTEPETTDPDGETVPGLHYQCALHARGSGGPYDFITLYAVQEAGWVTIAMTRKAAQLEEADSRSAAPRLEIDRIQAYCG